MANFRHIQYSVPACSCVDMVAFVVACKFSDSIWRARWSV